MPTTSPKKTVRAAKGAAVVDVVVAMTVVPAKMTPRAMAQPTVSNPNWALLTTKANPAHPKVTTKARKVSKKMANRAKSVHVTVMAVSVARARTVASAAMHPSSSRHSLPLMRLK